MTSPGEHDRDARGNQPDTNEDEAERGEPRRCGIERPALALAGDRYLEVGGEQRSKRNC
jgi:hypothetical protein